MSVLHDESGSYSAPEPAICPECKVGKCGNCDTTAWDFVNDMPTHCECWANGHRDLA